MKLYILTLNINMIIIFRTIDHRNPIRLHSIELSVPYKVIWTILFKKKKIE